jgi:tetratricopeptide (TPR) repeat protein
MLCCGLASMTTFLKSAGVALRIVVTVACCSGIWISFQTARADLLFREDTAQSIQKAIEIAPDGWPYYMRLAQLDRANATKLISTSLRLNPYDAQANIELGLQYEANGDFAQAQKQLLQAYAIDHTYLPRWTLANYYYRRGDMDQFWAWARSAAAMPADDIGALLVLCWRATPDTSTITRAILNEKPEFLRQYLNFLLVREQPRAAADVAEHLLRADDRQSDLPVLLSVLNHLVTANDSSGALGLWQLLMRRNWVIADSTVPNNPRFLRAPVASSFDWSIPEYQGMHSWPGPSGLQTEFSGTEPEDCVVAEQTVALKPGNYALVFAYRTSHIPSETGLRWQILDSKSQKILTESNDLSSDANKESMVKFLLDESSLVVLRLGYRRALGTVRISGMLNMQSVHIETLPAS